MAKTDQRLQEDLQARRLRLRRRSATDAPVYRPPVVHLSVDHLMRLRLIAIQHCRECESEGRSRPLEVPGGTVYAMCEELLAARRKR